MSNMTWKPFFISIIIPNLGYVKEKWWCRKFIKCRKKSHVGYPSHSEGAGSFIWSKKALNRWCWKFIRCREKSHVAYPCHTEGAGSFILSMWCRKFIRCR